MDAGDTLHAVVADDTGTYYEIIHFAKPSAGAWSAGDTVSDIVANQDSKQPCLAADQDLTLTVIWSESDRIRMVAWE
jgi:hypothetical protein